MVDCEVVHSRRGRCGGTQRNPARAWAPSKIVPVALAVLLVGIACERGDGSPGSPDQPGRPGLLSGSWPRHRAPTLRNRRRQPWYRSPPRSVPWVGEVEPNVRVARHRPRRGRERTRSCWPARASWPCCALAASPSGGRKRQGAPPPSPRVTSTATGATTWPWAGASTATFGAPPAELRVYRTRGASPGTLREQSVSTPRTPRAQFGSIQITALEADGPPGILFTHYVSKYDVRGAFRAPRRARRAGASGELYRMRMGALLLAAPGTRPDAPPRLLVGRTYGDATRSPGDVFVLGKDGSREWLPSLRGVRSVAAVALGGPADPFRFICYGDGWHWRYRDDGRGRLTCVQDQAGRVGDAAAGDGHR